MYIAIVIGVILLSMTLHEVMHGYVAYLLGDDTAKALGRLTLNPVKHIDPFLTIILPIFLAIAGGPIFGGAKPVPFNPTRLKWDEWGVALVAVAGPLTNLLIAFVMTGIWAVVGTPAGDTFAGLVLQTAIGVNLGFFVFNLLPIPPLDGSRVLYALAPDFVRRGMMQVEQYGIFVVFAVVIFASSYIGQFMGSAIQFFFELFLAAFRI